MKRSRTFAGIKKGGRDKKRFRKGPAGVLWNSQVPLATKGWRFGSTEKKVMELPVFTAQVNLTGQISVVNAIQLGTDIGQRIGRKVMIKSVYVRGFVGVEQAIGTNDNVQTPPQLCRMIILVDQQPNGAVPAATDILVSAHACSQLNLANRDRFKILADKTYDLDMYINHNGASIR